MCRLGRLDMQQGVTEGHVLAKGLRLPGCTLRSEHTGGDVGAGRAVCTARCVAAQDHRSASWLSQTVGSRPAR